MSIISFLAYFIPYIIKKTLYFLKIIKQIFEKFKLISNKIAKKIKWICQKFLMIINFIIIIIIICIFSSNSEKNKYERKKDYEIIVKDDKVDTKASIKNTQVIVGYYNNCAIVMTANENEGNLVITKKIYNLYQ